MKTMKKVFALLLAVVMVMGLSVTAFADGETYSITIDDAINGQTYSAYKIFDATAVTSTDADTGETTISSISYTISTSSKWYTVMTQYTQGEGDAAYNPFVFTSSAADESVKVVTLGSDSEGNAYTLDPAVLAAYLNTALHAEGANYTYAASDTASGNSVTLDVSDSGAGYYFVDTSLGALCSLNNVTGTQVTMKEKNAEPTLAKTVEEDSTGVYGASATADMKQTVNFKLTVTTGSDSSELEGNYVITDTLPAGMTYVYTEDTSATDGGLSSGLTVSTVTKDANDEEVKTAWTSGYSVTYENDKLTITLAEANLEALGANATIEIAYSATVDQDAVVAGTGNTNTATLAYHGYTTTQVSAVVYTYQIGEDADGTSTIVKVDGSTLGANGEVTTTTTKLAGVKFVLSKTVNGTPYYAVLDEVKNDDETVTGYKLSSWTTTATAATSIVTDAEGNFLVQGLDADTYILTETETLPGYNLMDDTITVKITEDGTVTYELTNDTTDTAGSTIIVKNNTGSALPSTGGIGTTIFYVVGSILVIGAAVLLITKKRMNGTAE